jgi:hypothetical protein
MNWIMRRNGLSLESVGSEHTLIWAGKLCGPQTLSPEDGATNLPPVIDQLLESLNWSACL